MKQLQLLASMALLAVGLSGCLDEHLTTEPPTILTDEQVWTSPDLIMGVLSNFYSRLPDYMVLNDGGDVPGDFVDYDEAIFGGNTNSENTTNGLAEYNYNTTVALGGNNNIWTQNYELIRDINLAIENITAATSSTLTPALKTQFISEMRFQRAWIYFDLVRRVGGVPLVTEQKIYDFSGDPEPLQQPRNSEAEVYDFIASEMDAIASTLGNENSKSRANRYAALALKSRATLYAGSIARHNAGIVPALPDGAVGIPASRAAEYYQKSLDASEAIINSRKFSLYNANPDPGQNFYEALVVKSGNPEVIWVKDYSASGGRAHIWTLSVVPPSLRLDALGGNQGSTVAPWLQLVEIFDYLDGSPGTLRGLGTGSNTAAGQANWIFYDKPEDIFANKDGRLAGTILYPGGSVRGGTVEIQAGVYVWNAAAGKYDRVQGAAGSKYTDGGVLTGFDGPILVQAHITPTGLYVKKYVDPNPAGATASTRSDVWWVRFRLGEIYLNAAEAAFELGLQTEALGYINTLRQRAGFPANSLTALTLAKIQNERWAELAFEEHHFFDMKRWRLAHLRLNGNSASTTANAFGLYPYRIVRPGHPDHGKYVYDGVRAVRQTRPRFFREGNYYAAIPQAVRNNNPKLVANPFH